jgi:quercetin dioxygenase-like cupin family protein
VKFEVGCPAITSNFEPRTSDVELMRLKVVRVSWRREGPLARGVAKALRAGVVVLGPSGMMARHSTGEREELLIVLSGEVRLETERAPARLLLREGNGAFIPPGTWHRVVNRHRVSARYLYVTAKSRSW